MSIFGNFFRNEAATKHSIRLGMTELPNNVYQKKQPITSNDFKIYVNDHFATKTKALGFKGRDFNYYREQKIIS